jgi:adenosylcobinamide-GDP ribazoletransferase
VLRAAFWTAVAFLTRLPVPTGLAYAPAVLGQSLVFYPVVGLLLGVGLAGLASALAGHPLVMAAVAVTAWAAVTGALHLDGLADLADLLLSGATGRERRQALLADPHVGTAAVVAVGCVLLLKGAALAELAGAGLAQGAAGWTQGAELAHGVGSGWATGTAGAALPCLLAPVAGRAVAALLLLATPLARPDGLAAALVAHAPRQAAGAAWAGIALVGGGLLAARGMGTALAALLGMAVVFHGVRRLALRLLGGIGGDALGATVELTETAVLLAVALATPPP